MTVLFKVKLVFTRTRQLVQVYMQKTMKNSQHQTFLHVVCVLRLPNMSNSSGNILCFHPLTTVIGQPFFGHKSPAARARELFKPSTDSATLLVDIDKNVFRFQSGFSGGDVTTWACFGNFVHLWPALGPNPLTHSIGSKFC